MTEKILVADDHALFRVGVKELIKILDDNAEVVEAESYQAAMDVINTSELRLALIDLVMPSLEEGNSIEKLIFQARGTPVVVVSASNNIEDMRRCYDAGAMGYVPKNEKPAVILNALQIVLSGGIYVPSEFMTRSRTTSSSPGTEVDRLTTRQRQILALLVDGKPNKEIANQLFLSEATVKAHLTAILKALNAKNRTQAVVAAQKLGVSTCS